MHKPETDCFLALEYIKTRLTKLFPAGRVLLTFMLKIMSFCGIFFQFVVVYNYVLKRGF